MPSSKPDTKLRASEAQIVSWKEAAAECGDSFNSWAVDALDAAAEFVANPAPQAQPFRKKIEGKRNQEVARPAGSRTCPAYHMKGIKCKLCGKAG